MSSQIISAIPRAQDRAILSTFHALAQLFSAEKFTINTITGANSTISATENKGNLFWKSLTKEDGTQIRHASVAYGNRFQVNFYRGGYETNNNQSPYWDHIGFEDIDRVNRIENELRLSVASIVQKNLSAFKDLAKSGAADDHFGQLFTQYDAALGTLRALSSEFLIDLAEQRSKFEKEMLDARNKLQNEFIEKEEILEKLHTAKSEELAARIKSVDDSDNKHARRAIRDKMLEDVSSRIQNFGVSSNTEGKRKTVKSGFIFLFFVFSILIASGIGESVHHLLYGFDTATNSPIEAVKLAAIDA